MKIFQLIQSMMFELNKKSAYILRYLYLTMWLTVTNSLVSFNHMVKSHALHLNHVFHALADATRRSILRNLVNNEKTVSQIAKPYRMSLAAISKHLKVLEAADLIERRKEGSFQIVSLNAKTLETAKEWLSYYQQFWDVRLNALQNLIEEKDK